MALKLADRIRESTVVAGAADALLLGPQPGYLAFGSALSDGDTTYYSIADYASATWETGIGTYHQSANSLSRTTILDSSSGSTIVSFAVGTVKDIFISLPSSKIALLDANGNLTVAAPTALVISGDGNGTASAGTLPLVLSAVGTVGTYSKVVTDTKGRVVAGSLLASSDVTGAIGYTPYNSTNPAGYISGNQSISVSGDASGSGATAIALTLAAVGSVGTFSKVTTDAKGRVVAGGAISSSDVTTALGFAPYPATNPNLYLTNNQTVTLSGDVSGNGANSITTTLATIGTAGTYTKVTTDAKGRVTVGGALAASDVTTALMFTPYNNTNPAGFISGNQTITASGDATGSGSTAIALTLAAVGAVGTYTKVTTDTKGRVVAGTSLTGSDVTTALGYTPYNSTNPSGYTGNPTIAVTGDATGSGSTAIALTLAASGVTAGASYNSVTVNSKGLITAASSIAYLTAAVTSISAGTGLSGGTITSTGTLGLANTGVTAGTYQFSTVAVNAQGQIVSASTGTPPPQVATTLIGDVTGSGVGTFNATLAATGVTAGTFQGLVVNAKGLISAATAIAYLTTAVTSIAAGTGLTGGTITGTGTIGLATSTVTPGTYSFSTITVNSQGIVTAANGNTPAGTPPTTLTGDVTGTGTGTFATTLAATGVAVGTYQGLVVNSKGLITSATSIAYLTANQSITISGDVSGTGTTGITATLASVGTAGTYSKLVTDAKGRVISGGVIASGDVTTALGYTPYNATNPSGYIAANQTITVSGDASGSGSTAIALTLAGTGVAAGTYQGLVINAKGLVTSASNQNYVTSSGVTSITAGTGLNGGTITTSGTIALANTAVTPGTYTVSTITVNAQGQITAAASGVAGVGSGSTTLTGDVTGTGTGTLTTTLAATGVTAGTYQGLVINAKGLVTSATVPGYVTGNQTITVTGDVSGSGTTAIGLTLATTGVTAGTYNGLVVNAKGLVTSASSSGYLSANQTITVTGDATGSGATAIALTLAATGVTLGTYQGLVVNTKGLVTSATNLGLGTMSTQAASAVAITGGSLTGVTLSAASLTATGAIVQTYRYITAAGNVSMTATDYAIILNKSTGAATTVTLPPSPVGGRTVLIKDGKGDAATNNITVTPASGTIDGSSSYVIGVGYAGLTCLYNGAEWSAV